MSREIKFRARFRKMLTGEEMWQFAELYRDAICNPRDSMPCGYIQVSDWEQYTGLNDQNDMEIYDGDIVTGIASPPNGSYKVNFTGIVKWDLEDAGFYFEVDGNWPCIKPWFVSDLVLIGNIHENPELLKK